MHPIRALAAPLFALVALSTLPAAEVTLTPLAPAQAWQRVEFTLGGAPTAENNYDPEQIRLDAEIIAPSGARQVVPAFWMVAHRSQQVGGNEHLTATDAGSWRLRYVPAEPGLHRVTLKASRASAPAETLGQYTFNAGGAASDRPQGWARVAADRRTFETSDGRPLRLVGENVCWALGAGTYAYEKWFDDLKRTGQNMARLWMCPWWLPLEQKPGPATHYQQDAAWQLDRVFQLAEERGIYLILALDFHGMFQIDNPHWGGSGNLWPKSPYHQNQGGPGIHPNDFFTQARAREIYQKRLRYLVGRYGASTHLFSWQFFNEIDNAYGPHLLLAPDVAGWHAAMGRWLKANDPYRHLVSTSLTGVSDRPEIWSLPEMDFAVYHSYNDPAPGKRLAWLADDFVRRYGKPMIVGEYGVDWRGWGGRGSDPHLRAQRQALWGTALSASAGAALTWWWEEIEADRAYPIFEALTAVLRRGGWFEGTWTPAQVDPALQSAPATAGELIENANRYLGPVSLGDMSHYHPRNEAAITGVLAARRASEHLTGYLHGPAHPDLRRPLRLDAWWSEDASLTVTVSEMLGAGELVIRIDGEEALRKSIPKADGGAPHRGAEMSVTATLRVPAGHHRIEIDNLGEQWLRLGKLQVQGLRDSTFAGGWQYPLEVNALRRGNRAILYVVSPEAVFPAGANTYRLPPQLGHKVQLLDWPEGRYQVTWFNPESGAEIAQHLARTNAGRLELGCPDFDADLAAVVEPEIAGHK